MMRRRIFLPIVFFLFTIISTGVAAQSNYAFTPATKVFITADKPRLARMAEKFMQQHSCLTTVPDSASADVIMAVVVTPSRFNDRKAYAVFSDAGTRRQVWQTPLVNTNTRFTFAPKRGAINKLVKRHLRGMCG